MRTRRSPGTERLREGPLRLFRLAEEIARLKGEADWTGGKRAITLAKQDSQRVVLLALRAGARVDEHLAAGALTVQVLEGRVQLTAGGERRTLSGGELLAVEAGLPHDVEAVDESVLLLTLAQPVGR